jgi:tetratricopeptide (TPR) repeat protein
LAVAIGVAVVWACGPFFGIEALEDRKQTLLAPPTVSFERELRALVAKPKDQLPVVETDQKAREIQEGAELKPDVWERVNKMRGQTTGAAAYELGDGLAPAIRDYTAGAVSFLHGDKEGARAHFEAVVSIPDAGQRRSRELWARYMLGRMAVQSADQEDAAKEFQAVRAAVRGGMPDPLGLAVASYGEEARGAWQQGSVAQAVELYATQAAYGSESGLNSLVTIAGLILKDYDLLDKGIQDDRTRRLLFICVNGNSSRAFFVGPDTGDRDDKTVQEAKDSNVDKIEAALERHQLKRVAGAGLLAAAAYHDGRFDLAEKLSALEDVPINAWVKAKLALRNGNRTAALNAYQKALEGFAAADKNDESGTLREIRAETGVLRVSRGDYAQALELFYGATDDSESWNGFQDYWGDVAYLAERVLTIDELKDYVDHHHLTATSPSKGESAGSRLRSILARRLMREGRSGSALRYFDDAEIRTAAQNYANALDSANRAWWPGFMKARAWMAAAQIARKNGLEILGYERQPDWAMWGGDFDPGYGSNPDPFQSGDERKRLNASKPALNERFQYRLTAVDEAKKAADLLPVKSQAYAAVLCEASEWVINRQPEMAQELYTRYVRNGAYVPWAKTFGETCPAANFGVDSVYGLSKKVERLRKKAQRHLVPTVLVAVGGTALISAAAYLVIGRRRRMAETDF